MVFFRHPSRAADAKSAQELSVNERELIAEFWSFVPKHKQYYSTQMGTLCQCVVRFCCDPEGGPERRQLQSFEVPDRMILQRGDNTTVPQEEHDVCAPGVRDLLRRLRDRWQTSSEPFYDIMRQHSEEEHEEEPLKKITASPVHQATSYSSDRDIPCIHSDEIVFPGSAIQQQMAEQLKSAKLKDDDIECVICMEPFDRENPRMPTLCGCGSNKTFFHLPCLYQWIEQSEECPSCREALSWEEF